MVRRIVMWAAGVVLVASVAAFEMSFFNVPWARPTGPWTVRLAHGAVMWTEGPGLPLSWYLDRADNWVPFWSLGTPARNGVWVVPLWMPAAAAAVVMFGSWLVKRHCPIRARAGQCPSCRYDLTGITGPCPECGCAKEREA